MITGRSIGVFFGSFNPVHVGHLVLANYMREFTGLDEVWFVVTPHNPLKEPIDLLEDRLRLEMVRLALQELEGTSVSDIEFRLPRPSYTVDTLSALKKEYPGNEFTLVIGADNWRIFERWKDHDVILQNHPVLIYPRVGQPLHVPLEFQKNVQVVNAPLVEISSTFIRNGIREGKNLQAFLPRKVYDYIEERKLYR